MLKAFKCERNARQNPADDGQLSLALAHLANFTDCCGDGTDPSAGHEPECAIGIANHHLEYHAGILSQPPRPGRRLDGLAAVGAPGEDFSDVVMDLRDEFRTLYEDRADEAAEIYAMRFKRADGS